MGHLASGIERPITAIIKAMAVPSGMPSSIVDIEGKDMISFVVFRSNIVKQFSYSFFLCHIYFCFLLIKYTYVSRITFISKA